MARIPMTSGFTICPEGTHVFRIYDVDYDEKWGKIEVKMVNAQGITHIERFSLKDKNDEPNESAMNAFSYFAKTALQNFDLSEGDEIEHTDLIDHYIRAEVVHTKLPSRKDPNKLVTFANLGDKSPADGFDTTPTPSAMNMSRKPQTDAQTASAPVTAPTSAPAGNLDLKALLG